jgi:uncharacterized membrane protein YphA (DoxX/SURF4 family)
MTNRRGLTPEHFDNVAELVRIGLGLFLLGNAWVFYELFTDPNLSSAFLWDRYGIHGQVAAFLTNFLFEAGVGLKPETFAAMAFGVQIAGGMALLAGFLTRYVASFFSIVIALIWLVHFVGAPPFVLGEGDSAHLKEPIAHLKQLGLVLLFRVVANLGSGRFSLDNLFGKKFSAPKGRSWNSIALELRGALALLFLSAAVTAAFFDMSLYAVPFWALFIVGGLVFLGISPRISGVLFLGVIGWHFFLSLQGESEPFLVSELVLSEAPYIAAAIVFMIFGSGDKLQPHKKLMDNLGSKN